MGKKRGRPKKTVVHLDEREVRVDLKHPGFCYLYYGSSVDGKQHTSSSVGMSPSSWATEEEAKQHAAAFLAKLSKQTKITILSEKETSLLQPQIAKMRTMLQQPASPAATAMQQTGISPAATGKVKATGLSMTMAEASGGTVRIVT
mgnify:CR=1 FL=1